jgi:uncharacterized membrane protein
MKIKIIIGILLGIITYEILRCTNSLMSKLFHDVLLTIILLIVFLYSYYNNETRENLQKKSVFYFSVILIIGLSAFLYFMGNLQTFKFSLLWAVLIILFLIFLQYKRRKSPTD